MVEGRTEVLRRRRRVRPDLSADTIGARMPVAWDYVPNAPSHVFKKPSVIPGFGLALGFSLTYLCLIVLIPLAGLVLKTSTLGWVEFWKIAMDGRTLAALRVSFGLSLLAAMLNA